jgi:hypothetical protein
VTTAAFLFGAARPVTVGVALRVVAVPLACTAEDTFDEDCGRDDEPVLDVCFVDLDGPAADELLDVDASFDPVEPEASADATAGIEAMAAPTPSATAEAPIHVKTRELLSAARPYSTRLSCSPPTPAVVETEFMKTLPLFGTTNRTVRLAGEEPSAA